MLQRLYIRNFAIIDELEIEFSEKLNIITGETGAGKSIILGALGLLKGDRAQAGWVRNEASKAVIEASYRLQGTSWSRLFEQENIDYQEETIIRRELSADGKTRSFVNDSPCTLQTLKNIGDFLVEIHSQHDSLEIKSSDYQMEILDFFADNNVLLTDIHTSYSSLISLEKELRIAEENIVKTQTEKELQLYHLQELNQYDFSEWKLDKMEEDLQLSENSLEIKLQLQGAVDGLTSGEINLVDGLKEIISRLRKFEKYSKELGSLNENFLSTIEQIQEVSQDYERLMDKIELNEEELEDLRSRFAFIQNLLKKHHKSSIEELSELKESLTKTLAWTDNLSNTIEELKGKIILERANYYRLAEAIHQRRIDIAPILEKQLLSNLQELELGNSQFQISITKDESQLAARGFDKVHFLFTANQGSPLRELKSAISGGEMSRFMLAIKSILAHKISLPTLIFDEIDTGVSGAVAHRVANMLEDLSTRHQIIAITHLPQIASRGYHHFSVFKMTENDTTSTYIKLLHQADREIEIAKMISGENITSASLTSARELLDR